MSEAIWAALANRHNFVRWVTRGDRERFAIVKVSSEGAGGWANAYAWQRISVCGGRD